MSRPARSYPARLAVGEHPQARFLLYGQVPGDGPVLGLAEGVGAERALRMRLARLEQPRRAQQAAHVLGVVLGGHGASLSGRY